MKNIKLTLEQIDDMRHCLGAEWRLIKRGRLYSYRNYFTTSKNGLKHLDELVDIGFMVRTQFGDMLLYRVTITGATYFAKLLGITVVQNTEDICQ